MTEKKRFKLGYVCGDFGLIDNDEWIDLHSMSENSEKNVRICINKMNELAEENEILKKTYDATENVNTALSKENEELHSLHGELIDKNNSLHKDVSSLVDEIVNLNSKIEHLEMENLQFKKVFNEIIKQVNVDLDPHYSRYAAIIVFSVQEFEFIREMMKEGEMND